MYDIVGCKDEHQAGAWAPFLSQQKLDLPAYHSTEFNTIFVGEHNSCTHAWKFSALVSAVRGRTQLLLELGLVDEAREDCRHLDEEVDISIAV